MTAAAILHRAEAEGVSLTLTPAGTIKAIGNPEAVNRLLPVIRAHKAEILAELAPDPVTQVAQRHGLTPERLRGGLTDEDVPAVHDNQDGERLWLEMFADIVAKGIIQEREQSLRESYESYEERAAIAEYDGGMERGQAEESAFREVYCQCCRHWTPDDVNPVMGLGECAIRPAGTLPLPWPMNTCWRGEFKEATLD
jgi:hypothetical protein